MRLYKYIIFLLFILSISGSPSIAQNNITSPKEELGFSVGEDYHLANYTQLTAYWQKLAQKSDRMAITQIGVTAEGRPMLMAIITSSENHAQLEHYKQISKRLALAEALTDEDARALAAEGRAVVWIDGGLHGTEVLGAQQHFELAYHMVSRNDAETLRILSNVILLAVNPNPDGMELVSDWYMQAEEPEKRFTRTIPRLYQKYIGHDNNRDFYMVTQPETEAVCRVLYHEWFPQIVYNQHQTGPAGCVMFAPPFRDPFNYCFDPIVSMGIELVGAAIHNRMVAEGKGGTTMRSGAGYSTWWNGGLRTTTYYHNMIGILTETIGNPTPVTVPFLPEKQLPKFDLPLPVAPRKWHFRQSVEYTMTANLAILDLAARLKEHFLYNMYLMGKNSIERGNQDNWTIHPKRIAAVQDQIALDKAEQVGRGRQRGYPPKYYEILRDPAERDPRGYIIPSDQPDFLTAIKFVNALIKNGVRVLRATGPFTVNEKNFPEGSYVIKTAHAFRPHILSMFEPQDYPDNIPCPGGPPTPTYDNAGWTLAYQMGVQFHRILDGFEGPFEIVKGFADTPPGKISEAENAAGFLLSHEVNDAFIAINRLIRRGKDVYWLRESFESSGKSYPPGTVYIPAYSDIVKELQTLAEDFGLSFVGTATSPKGDALKLRPMRIGLWGRYGGSMPSGWTRWLFEQFEFPYQLVFPAELDAGNLIEKFDVLIFVDGAIPLSDKEEEDESRSRDRQPKLEEIPAEFHNRLGKITVEKTVPHLRQFVADGGTLIAIGDSTSIGYHAGLPVEDYLVEILADGKEQPLPDEKLFVPGSILQARVDNTNPLAYGIPENVDVIFRRSPAFKLNPDAHLKGVRAVAWYDSKTPLRSGWAWGQHYLEGGIAVIEASSGKGKLFLFGPEITFRAQSHGTFKFLFNSIYYGASVPVKLQ